MSICERSPEEGFQKRQAFHILVVDDDPSFRLSLRKLLSGMGFPVNTAGDGPEALAILAQQKIDLVFSDVKMRGMTGIELLKKIKTLYPETHVVLVTAYSDLTSESDALDMLASGYLSKPVKRYEIQEVLNHFCGHEAQESIKNTIT